MRWLFWGHDSVHSVLSKLNAGVQCNPKGMDHAMC